MTVHAVIAWLAALGIVLSLAASNTITPEGTAVIARHTVLTPPAGTISSGASPTIATVGSAIFTAFNFHAAISSDNGGSYSYIDPSSLFPTAGAFAGGCCRSQRASQAPSRDLIFWLLEYFSTPSFPYTNGLRLAVAHGQAGLAANSWQYHDITAAEFGMTLLYSPRLQVSANYLYFTATTFDTTHGQFRAVIGRIPLAALDANAPYSMDTYVSPLAPPDASYIPWVITPVDGATHTMYFGTTVGPNSIKVLTWPEVSTSPTVTAVDGLASTGDALFVCVTPGGFNPCGWADTSMQTGWITPTELGFMWNAPADAAHPYPYTRVVVLDPSTPQTIVSQPDIASPSSALLYAALAVNARGHLGGTIDRLGGASYTSLLAIIRDDLSPDISAGGWETFPVAEGNASPLLGWGDLNGVVPHEQYPNTWVGAGHVQIGTAEHSGSSVRTFWFMRNRDVPGGGQTTTVALTDAAETGPESAGTQTFTIRLTTSDGLPAASAGSVAYSTTTGSAAANADFTSTSGTLTWNAATPSGTTEIIGVPIAGDLIDEVDETYTVSLSNPANSVLGLPVQIATIQDDDTAAISLNDVSIVEGSAGTRKVAFTASLAAPSTRTISVNYTTENGAAASGWNPTQVFGGGGITIPSNGELSPYPATINVSGVSGLITKVTVTLTGLTHTSPTDLDLVLESPLGQKVVLMSDVAGGFGFFGHVTLKFDDAGAQLSGNPLVSGTYSPTNVDDFPPDEFHDPAPAAPYADTLAAFAGSNANGVWKLYVNDDFPESDGGAIGAWSLGFESAESASDYHAAAGSIVFPPGSTAQSIDVSVGSDTAVEDSENFFVNLSSPINAVIADGKGQATIVNDDTAGGGGSGGGGDTDGGSPEPSAPPPPPPPPPSPIPEAPFGLNSVVFGATVVLSWKAPASGAPATAYFIEVGSRPGATDLLVYPTGNTLQSITATNVSDGTYFVRVRAGNSLGLSPPSNEIVVGVPDVAGPRPSAPPGAPANLQAFSDASNVTLTWIPPAVGGAPTYYIIEAGSAPGLSNLASFSTGVAVPSFAATAVPNGTYFVRVRAGNAWGVSAPSNEVVLFVGGVER